MRGRLQQEIEAEYGPFIVRVQPQRAPDSLRAEIESLLHNYPRGAAEPRPPRLPVLGATSIGWQEVRGVSGGNPNPGPAGITRFLVYPAGADAVYGWGQPYEVNQPLGTVLGSIANTQLQDQRTLTWDGAAWTAVHHTAYLAGDRAWFASDTNTQCDVLTWTPGGRNVYKDGVRLFRSPRGVLLAAAHLTVSVNGVDQQGLVLLHTTRWVDIWSEDLLTRISAYQLATYQGLTPIYAEFSASGQRIAVVIPFTLYRDTIETAGPQRIDEYSTIGGAATGITKGRDLDIAFSRIETGEGYNLSGSGELECLTAIWYVGEALNVSTVRVKYTMAAASAVQVTHPSSQMTYYVEIDNFRNCTQTETPREIGFYLAVSDSQFSETFAISIYAGPVNNLTKTIDIDLGESVSNGKHYYKETRPDSYATTMLSCRAGGPLDYKWSEMVPANFTPQTIIWDENHAYKTRHDVHIAYKLDNSGEFSPSGMRWDHLPWIARGWSRVWGEGAGTTIRHRVESLLPGGESQDIPGPDRALMYEPALIGSSSCQTRDEFLAILGVAFSEARFRANSCRSVFDLYSPVRESAVRARGGGPRIATIGFPVGLTAQTTVAGFRWVTLTTHGAGFDALGMAGVDGVRYLRDIPANVGLCVL